MNIFGPTKRLQDQNIVNYNVASPIKFYNCDIIFIFNKIYLYTKKL